MGGKSTASSGDQAGGGGETTGRSRATRMSKQKRRALLLQSALALNAENGLGNVNHSELAVRAEVSIATAFHYFPTRESLTEAVAGEVSRYLIDEFVEVRIERRSEVSAETISEMLLAFVAAIDEHPNYILIWMHWSAGVKRPTWPAYVDFQTKAIQALKRLLMLGIHNQSIRPDLDCDVANRVILNTAFMLAQMKFSGSSQVDIERAVHSLVGGYISA